MNVGELIEKLKEFPLDLPVLTSYDYYGDPRLCTWGKVYLIKELPQYTSKEDDVTLPGVLIG